MRKLKKIISTAMAIALILTISQGSVWAAKNNKSKKNTIKKNTKISYIASKKSFDDIWAYPWAERAIEKLRLKGLVKGTSETKFAPQNNVTKLESVIMALRVMGWEDEATSKKLLPSRYKGKKIQDWAMGYVSVAFAKGILDEVDMLYFDPDAPAARHEVAKYVIRALGYADEAEDNMNQKLPFIDAAAVPQGSVGYVYLINKMGLMIGDNGIFNPMGTLTRAEMAVLFSRLDDKVDNDLDESEYKGTIESISSSKIKINVDEEILTFFINQDDVKVYKNDKKVSFSTLKENDLVLIQLYEDEVVYIEILDKYKEKDDKIISKYTGDVTKIDTSNNTITIRLDTMLITFEATKNVEVYFKNGEGNFEDIVKGDTVTVIVDTRNRAREIRVDRNLKETAKTTEIEGKITAITKFHNGYKLKISVNKVEYTYDVSEDVVILFEENDEYAQDIKDLEIGQKGEFYIDHGIITKIVIVD